MIMVSNTIKTAPFSSQDQQGVWEARPSRDPTMQNATTMQQVVPAEPDEWHSGEKTALFVHFYIKMTPFKHFKRKCIILPRQARDKHRENTQNSWRVALQACQRRRFSSRTATRAWSESRRSTVPLSSRTAAHLYAALSIVDLWGVPCLVLSVPVLFCLALSRLVWSCLALYVPVAQRMNTAF